VPLPALVRWLVIHLFRSPANVALMASLLLAPSLQRAIHPTTPYLDWAEVGVRGWLFPATLVAAAQTMELLHRHRWLMDQLGRARRLSAEWVLLAFSCAALQVPILFGALLSGIAPADVGRLLPAILTSCFHIGALALVLLSFSLSARLRVSLLLLAAWLAPALLLESGPTQRLFALFDPRAAIYAVSFPDLVSPVSAACALGLVALLVRTSSGVSPE
jgi:hypothetical protein